MFEHLVAATALLFLASPVTQAQSTDDSQPWRDLFDGKTLQNWDGDPDLWRVESGVLIGSTASKKIRANTFLIWKGGEVADFELRAELRVIGNNNSGIQYRSRVTNADAYAVAGYQADVHPNAPYCGMLYEESGRGIVAQSGQSVTLRQDGKRNVTGKPIGGPAVDLAKWHEIGIRARGDTLVHTLDGKQTIEVIDRSKKARRRGVLALQLHRGANMRLEVRKIRLRTWKARAEVARGADGAKKPKSEGPVPNWIWLGSAKDGDVVYFRRKFEVTRAGAGTLSISCDNKALVWLDGKQIGRTKDWSAPRQMKIAKLTRGTHVIAIRAENEGGPAGLLASLRMGKTTKLLTDAKWLASRNVPEGWREVGFDDSKWEQATALGPVGSGPWGNVVTKVFGSEATSIDTKPVAFTSTAADELQLAPGFTAERLATIPKRLGSWVSLGIGPKGEFYASDQRAGMYRFDVGAASESGSRSTTVRRLDVDLGGAQGLCFANGALYACVNGRGSGLWRLRDKDGDGLLDDAEQLTEFVGAGEHGPHALILTPDKNAMYVVCGNHTAIPPLASSRVPRAFGEDRLPPPIVDPRGHANKIRAPGGYICRVDFEGKDYELVSTGFRNVFDIALDANGELFAYDADMEWDFGLPWYRPTRIVHAAPGSDFGWRTGSAKWETYCEDSLPPVHEIGPGSPTGLLFAYGSRFPADWARKLYALDWTFGTIWAIDLIPSGSSFRATRTPFVTGKPLTLTDAVIGTDGAMYFLTGGRGTETRIYRVAWSGGRDGATAQAPRIDTDLVGLRHRLERITSGIDTDDVSVDEVASHLDHQDRFVRHAARVAIETMPDGLQIEIDAKHRPLAAAVLMVARARHLERKGRNDFFEAILQLPFESAADDAKLAFMRACEIAIARHGKPKPSLRRSLIAKVDPLFPSGAERLDAEMARLLCSLDSETAVAKCIALMDGRGTRAAEDWTELLDRNDRYGKPIRRMLDNPPPTRGLHYANCMRMTTKGWTPARRERVFEFLRRARRYPAGNSYPGFIDKIRDALVASMSIDEKRRIAKILGAWDSKASERFTLPKGPGRTWTVEAALGVVDTDDARLEDRSYVSGRNLYHSIGCAGCHRYDGDGGGVGPDLTSAADKYSVRELLESLIEPDKVIADQFVAQRIKLKDGKVFDGQVVTSGAGTDEAKLEIWPASAHAKPVRIDAKDIENIAPAAVSPMPKLLLDGLNEGELKDLIAFLLDATSHKRSKR